MTGRYRITMLPLLDNGVARVWESEKRMAQRWQPVRRNLPFAPSRRTQLQREIERDGP